MVPPSMRKLLVPLLVLSCSDPVGPKASLGPPVGVNRSAVAWGTTDSTHTAVVALLALAAGGQSYDECTGTIVQVQNGQAYVLTAAHCCNNVTPEIVVMSNDYTVGEQYWAGEPL